MRLAVITPVPTPYRDPFWNVLGTTPGVELTVYYCRRGDPDRPWNISWKQTFAAVYPRAVQVLPHGESYWNPHITTLLRRHCPDALILGGYNHLTMLAAAWFALRRRIPYYLMSEVYLGQPRSRWRRVLKVPIVRWVVRRASGCLPTGTLATDYLIHYGALPDRICQVPNVPDLDGIRTKCELLLPQRDSLRQRLGWSGHSVVLFVGRLLALKRVDTLIRAFSRAETDTPALLAIAGDGPERQRLERLCHKLGIASRVRFLGFVPPENLIELYCAADLFVLPSSDETWGVVVLEAVACGLPVIVSNMVGCHPDVVVSPHIGDVVPAGDSIALASQLTSRLSRPARVPFTAWRCVYDRMNYYAVAERLINFIRSTVETDQAKTR